MPGEPLMCVWETAFALDIAASSKIKKHTLQKIVQELNQIPHITYDDGEFNTYFSEPEVDFFVFKHYVESILLQQSVSLLLITEEIEQHSWNIVSDKYSSKIFSKPQIYNLWCIFNRMCTAGSYPPRMNKRMCTNLLVTVSGKDKEEWSIDQVICNNGLRFNEMIIVLDSILTIKKSLVYHQLLCWCCYGRSNSIHPNVSTDSKLNKVNQCLEDLFCSLVQEVMKAGWMSTHIRRNGNRSSWMKQWFVLTPGYLRYYSVSNNNEKILKGQILVDKFTRIGDMENNNTVTGIQTDMNYMFNISDNDTEAEFAVDNLTTKQEWLSVLKESEEAIRCGVTPQMKILQKKATLGKTNIKLNQVYQEHINNIDNNNDDILNEMSQNDIEVKSFSTGEYEVSETAEDILSLQKEKMRTMFFYIDKNCNGKIEREEFVKYVSNDESEVDQKEANQIFNLIDKDSKNYISFDEFESFIKQTVLCDEKDDSMMLRRFAFVHADKDGSGTINFQEFCEYVYTFRKNIALGKLIAIFHNLDTDDDGEITYDEFQIFINDTCINEPEDTTRLTSAIEVFFKNSYKETNVSDLESILKSRWKKLTKFERLGHKGKLVMTGEKENVEDVLPGEYSLLDLTCFMPPIEPKKTVVKEVTWVGSNLPGRSGRIIFPQDYDGQVSIEISTSDHLAYYGCSLADSNENNVFLFLRHCIQDITYHNNYLEDYVTAKTGPGLETHPFSHLDCPLGDDSGFLVIGKFVDNELHLTAFKVPTRHTVYIPGGVVHTNDYLKGTWRTMLSDQSC